MQKRIEELSKKIKEASNAYYNHTEIMSDAEFDSMQDELERLLKESGIVLADNPLEMVGADVEDGLKKVTHEFPCLSLKKTKNISEFVKAFKYMNLDEDVVLMWKLDGSTLEATYEKGNLVRLLTRGNGEIGSDVTHNASNINGIPLKIPYGGKLIVRGEGLMSHSEFNRINTTLLDTDDEYKNERNLANATITALDGNVIKERRIDYLAFNIVYCDDIPDLFEERLIFMKENGFNIVPYVKVSTSDLADEMAKWENKVPLYDFAVDGLVCALNNAKYADTLSGTNKYPHILRGFAFKWADELAETVLRKIEWSTSRTGLINPVAVFDEVSLEGTTVSRATLHNVSYILDRNLKVGDKIQVYKANKIIPKVVNNLDASTHGVVKKEELITTCPCCGSLVVFNNSNDVFTAICPNFLCEAKKVYKLIHFASKEGLDIRGVSEETIKKFVELGYLNEFCDFWNLSKFENDIVNMEGFGRKSYDKMIAAIEKARKVNFVSLLTALGVPNVGKGQAKLLKKHFSSMNSDKTLWFLLEHASLEELNSIDGIGDVISSNIVYYFDCVLSSDSYKKLINLLEIVDNNEKVSVSSNDSNINGMTFVITGDLNHFKNRNEMIELIESKGGKVSGSVSSKTNYLINNDVNSTSGKNKKAKELNIPIISESDFLDLL